MGALLLLLLLALILFGLGFALKVLWWVALALVVVWIIGMVRRSPSQRWGHR
jgi:hypothetical protein